MLGLWSLGTTPLGFILHLAFDVALNDLVDAPKRLKEKGIKPLSFFGVETTEPSVICWMPEDLGLLPNPDGHTLEYLTMLDKEPRPELGIIPWSEWLDQNKSYGGSADCRPRMRPCYVSVLSSDCCRDSKRAIFKYSYTFNNSSSVIPVILWSFSNDAIALFRVVANLIHCIYFRC